MAREYFQRDLDTLQSRKSDIENEREALQAGEAMWADCVDIVTTFEADLRTQMKEGQDAEMLKRQSEKMRVVVKRLEDCARIAEGKGWNLLICAVGAELAAFKEGEEILKGALGVTNHEDVDKEESFHSFEEGSSLRGGEGSSLPRLGQSVNRSLDAGDRKVVRGMIESENENENENDSDGPNLDELMVEDSRGSVN